MDLTNETLIQKYDRENPEEYREIAESVLKDKKYRDANRTMKQEQVEGNLVDKYTGKKLGENDKANLDHVISRKELYENQRRKQANLDLKDVANKDENLKATNESLNKSKGAKTNTEYIKGKENLEEKLVEEVKNKNDKIDKSDLTDSEKKLAKENNNKRLQDKLDADGEMMINAEKDARKAINKDIKKGVVKEVSKKSLNDALKRIVISSLVSLLKEIVNQLISFFKEKQKSIKKFLEKMKTAIKVFFGKISTIIKTESKSIMGTIVTEILGPIISIFKKLSSFIKQGMKSLGEVFTYLKDNKNKDKPLSIKMAQIGKIITASLVGAGGILLSGFFESKLSLIPGMQVKIPVFGSLASVIGLFFSSLVSALIGAIILNFIDKFISKRLMQEKNKDVINKKNEILNLQNEVIIVSECSMEINKLNNLKKIKDNHIEAKKIMEKSLSSIFIDIEDDIVEENNIEKISINNDDLLKIQNQLEKLL